MSQEKGKIISGFPEIKEAGLEERNTEDTQSPHINRDLKVQNVHMTVGYVTDAGDEFRRNN